jgi:hypothetical protein
VSLYSQFFLQPLYDAHIFGYSSADGKGRHYSNMIQQGHNPFCQGVTGPGKDIIDVLTVAQEPHNVEFGKQSARTVDLHCPFHRLERSRADFIEGNIEKSRNSLKITTRSGSTFLIHSEVGYFSTLVASDGLAVLPSHVQNGTHLPEKPPITHCMT